MKPQNNEPLFTTDELAELERLSKQEANGSSGNNFYGGVRRKRNNEVASPPQQKDEEEKKDNGGEIVQNLPRYTGQARGYAMLYLMHPRARKTAEAEIKVMLDSQVRELFLGVLVDGTFGFDFNYISDVIQRLSADGRILYLTLYLTNGATQRVYDVTDINVAFNRIEPKEFRERIKHDNSIRSQFLSLVRRAKQIFDFSRRTNPRNVNIAIMMLEDNLDSDAYQEMRVLARSVLGSSVTYMRNPCPGCYEGNDTYAFGDRVEMHNPAIISSLESGDAFTMDGKGLLYSDEIGNGLPVNVTHALLLQSLERNLAYYGLWRAVRQGLTGSKRVHPDQRNFEVPSLEQIEQEIELLRTGLDLIPEQAEEE